MEREVRRRDRKVERIERRKMRVARRPKGTRRARVVALLLILVMALGFLNALFVAWEAGRVQAPDEILSERNGNLYGRVTDMDGRPIDGAEVSVVGTGYRAFTNEEGWYFIESLPVDTYSVEVNMANYTSVIKKVKVEENMHRSVNFQLELGSGVERRENVIPGDMTDLSLSYAYSVILGMVFSVVAGIGAFLSLRRKGFGTAVACGVLGILSYGFLVGALLGILSVLLLISARPAFEPGEGPRKVYEVRREDTIPGPGEEDETTFEELDLEVPGEGKVKVQVGDRPVAGGKVVDEKDVDEVASIRELESRKADTEIDADEGEVIEPPEEEVVMEAEVREELVDRDLEAEGEVEDTEGELEHGPRRRRREIEEMGPEVVPSMEKALQDTLESPDETETDIVSSVLKKLDLDRPSEPLRPPKKRKVKRRALKSHQERELCRICVKPIIISSDAVHCPCGRAYHVHCAANVEKCPNCGKDLPRD